MTRAAAPRLRALADILNAFDGTGQPVRLACVAADDEALLLSLQATTSRRLVRPILIGAASRVLAMAARAGLEPDAFDVADVPDRELACAHAVTLCRQGRAGLIMKGAVPTSVLLKSVLHAEYGLRTGCSLAHVAVFAPRGYDRLMVLADAGVQIAPDADHLVGIVAQAARVARCLGVRRPRVALLSATEVVNPSMPSSVVAEEVARACAVRGDLDADVGGPYALDVAVSPAAAAHKGVANEVAGRADVLIAPGIDAGNVLYKALTCFGGLDLASVVVGAAVPMVIPSRADTELTKVYSTALALLLARLEENVRL